MGNPGVIGRKYRECYIDDSYAESFRASYWPTAYNLASTDDLAEQSNCDARREVIPGAISSVSQTRVWDLLIGDLVVVIRCASGSTPSQLPAQSLQRGARGLPSGLYALRAGSGPGGESTTARRGDLLTIGIDQ